MGEVIALNRTGIAQDAEISGIPDAPEQYARSLRSIRLLGEAMVFGSLFEADSFSNHEAFVDFTSAVEENLATDPMYKERLRFNPLRYHQRVNGHVVDRSGRRMVDLIDTGCAASLQAVASEPEMVIQVERDEGDGEVVRIVDGLEIGEMYAVVLMDPKEALQRNPRYWESKGYRNGMAVLQVYYRATEDSVLAGAYSINDSELAAMRQQLSRYGVDIPPNESENRYVRHGIRSFVSQQEAEDFGDTFVNEYNKVRGTTEKAISTTQIVRDHHLLVRECFETFLQPLAAAYISQKTSDHLQQFANSLLSSGVGRTPREQRSLARVANGLAPNDEDVRFFEEKIRYGLVEELRKSIPRYLGFEMQLMFQGDITIASPAIEDYQRMNSMQLALNIQKGAQAGRNYGGCASASGEMFNEIPGVLENELGKQDIFSGNGESLADDRYGSRYFSCPKNGCRNTRPKDKLIPKCQKCGADVSCGNDTPKRSRAA